MPTRRTVSRSYRGLFGSRVRYTTTQTYGSRQPNVQLRLTGHELLELQRQQAEAVAQTRAEEAAAQKQHMATLNGAAAWLHTPLGAIITLVVYAIGMVIAFGFSNSGAVMVTMALPIALAVIDWRNFSSFHGAIPWNVWKVEGKSGRWWTLSVVLWLYGWAFMPAVYAVQAWTRAGEVLAARHAALDAQIAALEAQVLPITASTTILPPPPPPVVPLAQDDSQSSNQKR